MSVCLVLAGVPEAHAQYGFDSGVGATNPWVQIAALGQLPGSKGQWLRIRGVLDPGTQVAESGGLGEAGRFRAALAEVHRHGFRICALVMPPGKLWASGVRQVPESNLPLDLREAYEWMARLGRTYGGLVDVWEIGNEPDIGFLGENAETYSAFFKACYWGAGPQVLMAPLALPPGPYLEALARNDLFSYTEGFNYHYYGYAADFAGVYWQFKDAAKDLNASDEARLSGLPEQLAQRQLPVFATEVGYGMLGAGTRGTVGGRVGQWRWFRSVAAQIHDLRLEAPMAFVLSPDLERGLNEFGLTMPSVRGQPEVSRGAFSSGGLIFTPADFGYGKAKPWMDLIGWRVGDGEASPALAYMIECERRQQYIPRAWTVQAFPPSRVVIDFVAGSGVLAAKAGQGYLLLGTRAGQFVGSGGLRIYNFSDHAIRGHLSFSGDALAALEKPDRECLNLPPLGLCEVKVDLAVPSTYWLGRDWRVRLVPDAPGDTIARFSTRVYPDEGVMRRNVVSSFDYDGTDAAGQRERLLKEPLADEEPALHTDGRWLVTTGTSVLEEPGLWRVRIDRPPNTSLRPAVAELPLPDDFAMPADSSLSLKLRCQSAGASLSRYAGLSTAQGGLMQIQLRTVNGNLYEVWPRRAPTEYWQTYQEPIEDFTMSFYGRANLPWRLRDNKLVSLVLTFWPRALPTEIEVRPTGWVRLAGINRKP